MAHRCKSTPENSRFGKLVAYLLDRRDAAAEHACHKAVEKRCAILEHELGLAQDNHQRGQTRGNDVTPKPGQESFQVWHQRHAQGFINARSWEEFHGIADAHGARLDLRANVSLYSR